MERERGREREREKQIIGRESDGGNVIERWDVAHINE